jgi:acyl-CoA dehydrogenase
MDADTLADFWTQTAGIRARFSSPLDRAVAGGFVSDRLGFAFASGYQASLRTLVPSLPSEGIASFCVTEEGGNHPRAIRTRVTREDGYVVVTGTKRWAIAAATELVVIGAEGTDAAGRPKLVAVRMEAGEPGLVVTPSAPPPFVPEVLHAELRLDAVRVPSANVLYGDGYDDFTKPFRTIEDLHVQAALLGYLTSVALRSAFPDDVVERLVALVVTARELSTVPPKNAEGHVALAGFLAQTSAIALEAEEHWKRVPEAEQSRWYRDRVLVQVAQKARATRRERAWQTLRGSS